MAEALRKLNRVDDSIKYLTKSINNQISSPSPNTTISLRNMAENYRNQNMKRESIVFYEYALDNSVKFNQVNELLMCYEALFNLYNEIKRQDKKESLYNSLYDLVNKNSIPKEFLSKAMLILEKNK
jgi:tetratricopeptide (TPR) repeat protein